MIAGMQRHVVRPEREYVPDHHSVENYRRHMRKISRKVLHVSNDKHEFHFGSFKAEVFVITKIKLETVPGQRSIVVLERFNCVAEKEYVQLVEFDEGYPVEYELEADIGFEDHAQIYVLGDPTLKVKVYGEFRRRNLYRHETSDEEIDGEEEEDYDE